MADQSTTVSTAFRTFMREAPGHAQAWGFMVHGLAAASALDRKTASLAYLAVLAGLRLESGIPFHVGVAKAAGATLAEVISAIRSACRRRSRALPRCCRPRWLPTTPSRHLARSARLRYTRGSGVQSGCDRHNFESLPALAEGTR